MVRAPSAYSWSQLFGFGFTPPAHPFTPSKDIFASAATPASLRSHLKSVRETPASPRSSIRYFSHEYPFEATIPATWVPWAIRPPPDPAGAFPPPGGGRGAPARPRVPRAAKAVNDPRRAVEGLLEVVLVDDR